MCVFNGLHDIKNTNTVASFFHVNFMEKLNELAFINNVSPSFLQIKYNLYPPFEEFNFDISFKELTDLTETNHSINVLLSSNTREVPGKISFFRDKMVFLTNDLQLNDKDDSDHVEVDIYYINVVLSKIFPHPLTYDMNPSNPSIFLVSFYEDFITCKRIKAISFIGSLAELNAINHNLKHNCENVLKRLNLNVNLDDINVSLQQMFELYEEQKLIPAKRKPFSIQSSSFKLFCNSTVLDFNEITVIRNSLPYYLKRNSWKKFFTLSEDGSSYTGIYDATKTLKHCLIVIVDQKHMKIGAFLPKGLKKNSKYYGTGEIFIFSFENGFKLYKWSGLNEIFVTSNMNSIFIGGGNSGSAIWINDNMNKGITDFCDTFQSSPLLKSKKFSIIEIEIWGFV